MEGSGKGSAGCVVHVNIHGECVTLWVAAMQLLLSVVYSIMQNSYGDARVTNYKLIFLVPPVLLHVRMHVHVHD